MKAFFINLVFSFSLLASQRTFINRQKAELLQFTRHFEWTHISIFVPWWILSKHFPPPQAREIFNSFVCFGSYRTQSNRTSSGNSGTLVGAGTLRNRHVYIVKTTPVCFVQLTINNWQIAILNPETRDTSSCAFSAFGARIPSYRIVLYSVGSVVGDISILSVTVANTIESDRAGVATAAAAAAVVVQY